MDATPTTTDATELGAVSTAAGRYIGVRKRKWGKWVSEVRLPNSRERIWLGSYDSPEKAALAFDAASFLLRGTRARLNFPDRTPEIAFNCGRRAATPQQIQVASASYAHAAAAPPPQLPQPTVSRGAEDLAPAAEWEYIEQLRSLTVFPAMEEFGYEWLQPGEAAEYHDLEMENCNCASAHCSRLWNF